MGGEDRQRQHRVRSPLLHQHERHRSYDTERPGPPVLRDERVGQECQRERAERGPTHVEPAVVPWIARLRHVSQGDRHAQRRERKVDQEHPAPAGSVDEPAADERADRRSDATEARPHADGPRSLVGMKAGLDDGERARRQQRAADTLQGTREDQHSCGRRETAQQRAEREPDHPDDEDPAAAVTVAERATQENQPGQRDRVRVTDPLQGRQWGVQVVADVRQRDIDDGGVQQRHAGAQHGREDDPAALGRGQADIHIRIIPVSSGPGEPISTRSTGLALLSAAWPRPVQAVRDTTVPVCGPLGPLGP